MPGSFWILALQILAAMKVFCIKGDQTDLSTKGGRRVTTKGIWIYVNYFCKEGNEHVQCTDT